MSRRRTEAPVPTSSARVRVRYAETDKMQVAYYANYFVWFEVGRGEFLRSLGSSYRELEAAGFMLPVIEAHCEYRRPAHYDDDLTVLTYGCLMSAARIRFDYEVQRDADEVVTAIGRTIHAVVDHRGRPTRLPIDIQEMLS
jgi:acyl-CoA thioester hydrolase